jgi:hypothetical protein
MYLIVLIKSIALTVVMEEALSGESILGRPRLGLARGSKS